MTSIKRLVTQQVIEEATIKGPMTPTPQSKNEPLAFDLPSIMKMWGA